MNNEIYEEKKKAEFFSVAKDTANSILEEVEKAVVGKRYEITLLVCAMLAGSHVLIEDVPGVGKTTLASALAKAAGLSFKRAQFTPDVMASDITGFNIYNRQSEKFEFREGLVACNMLLADEVNRASPKTQSSLLEAMEEFKVTVDGVTYELPKPFMVIATQNPSGFVGTYPLPEAQLDRFAMKISMGYPSADEELNIISSRMKTNPLADVSAVADVKTIETMRDVVTDVLIDKEICKYIVSLVSATRNHPSIILGASPRASLALMHLSKAWAFMKGRDYVLPEDVRALYKQTLSHRIVLSQEARLGRASADSVLGEILARTEVPYKGTREEVK